MSDPNIMPDAGPGAIDTNPGPTRHPQPPTLGPAPDMLPVSEPLPDEVPAALLPALKAQAARESGGCNDVRIATVDGIDHEFALRRPTKAEWDVYLDAAFQPPLAMDASREIVADCCMWPDASTMRMIADERTLPALPMRLCDHLETWVGYSAPREIAIDAKTSPATLAAAGLDPDVVAALLAQYPGKGQLRACVFTLTPKEWADEDQRTAVVILKRPTKGDYQSFVLGYQTTAKAAASSDAAMACCVYPVTTEARRKLFAEAPGIPAKLADVIATMGGAVVRSTAKKA